MTNYYHFFGIKDKGNRFTMRVNNPLGFNILSAIIKLSQLFSVHGVCPASNDVTWTPWKSGKTLYQWWNVTPNKLGIIKSYSPTFTLDGIDYISVPIYLLSLNDYTNIYSDLSNLSFPARWRDLSEVAISGYLTDFLPIATGTIDILNMTGIFISNPDTTLDFNTIKPWIESGNILIYTCYTLTNAPYSTSRILPSSGDYVKCVVNESELEPICLTTGSIVSAIQMAGYTHTEVPPAGWTTRTLVEINVAGTSYHMIQEFTHTASGGKLIIMMSRDTPLYYTMYMPSWWYPILAFQYPMMKYAGVAAYFTE